MAAAVATFKLSGPTLDFLGMVILLVMKEESSSEIPCASLPNTKTAAVGNSKE